MAGAASALIPIFFILNVIFFTFVSSGCAPCPPTCTAPPSVPRKAPTEAVRCPRDTLKFGVCGDWLGLVHEVVGVPPSAKCCALVEGLADLEAALCLCTAIKGNVLGVVKYDIQVAVSLVINSCGKKLPKGFACS
ncbi:putative lipid-binding protein At4g00165 [Andrographis paniculata]|uniref:putative lipid-binding protein At4g00165 n=1 Tax=Andrographis paniculata TaxID=175694 RepID=UPI0021E7C03E|nr:putative lipid-binding protein At4g00165 [Andrographis paniculata]